MVTHTHLVLEKIDAVLTELLNAETGQRGYVITGEESYLGPYHTSVAHIHQTLKELRELTGDNATQQRRLDSLEPLTTARLAVLEDRIQIRKQEGVASAAQAIRRGSGKELMDKIREGLREMRSEEQRLLQQRSEVADASSKKTRFVLGAAYVTAFLLLLGAGVVTRGEMRARRGVEHSLRVSEEHYRLLFESNPHPVWVYDVESLAILDVNQAAVHNYGYSRDEFRSLTIKDIRPPEDVPAVLESVTAATRSREVEMSGVWRHRKKDGRIIHAEIVSHPLMYGGKEARLVVATDITKRKIAEDRLRANEERFRSLAETANDAIISADSHGNIVYFNRAGELLFGYAASEICGQPLTLLMPSRFQETHRRGFQRFLTTREPHVIGKTVELAGKRKDGTEFPLQLSLAVWATSEGTFFTGILSDISERKRAEEALRQSEERFRLMVSNVKDYAILMLDPEGRVVSWNEGAERIKGYRAEEIIGKHFSCFYPAEDVQNGKPTLELQEAAKHGRFEEEGWRLRKDGLRFWASVVVTALRDEKGTLRGFGKVTRDITERRRAEQEILHRSAELAAANKELEAFSYSVSHDLRAPLRGIDGFSQAVLEDYAQQLDDTGKDYLQRIRAGTQRMGALIDDLLNLSRVTRAEMHRESVDLSSLAKEVAAELSASHPDRKVDFKVAAGLKAKGDTRLLRIVLQNLIGNSWKFTSKRPQAEIEFALTQENGKPAYFVRDNGAGFDSAYAAGLFGAFQRLHAMNEFPGTGIGLATVQRIIHRHGGDVWAEGAVNQGATFYFTL